MTEGRDATATQKKTDCSCGSGLSRRDLTDARGIFCTFVCDQCEGRKRERYQPHIFTDAAYWADEPIGDEA